MNLSPEEMERYSRQTAISGFGTQAQEKLKQARVAVFGVGGVGSVAALYLAAAGVGHLVLVDRDVVSLSNLNRQILYSCHDLNESKAALAETALLSINPDLNITGLVQQAGIKEIRTVIKDCSFVIDAFDRIPDRLAINQACVEQGIAAAHGFVQELAGEIIVVKPKDSPCLHCVLDPGRKEPKTVPVLGTAAGAIGIQLANAAIKFLSGYGMVQYGYRLLWDLAMDQYFSLKLQRRPDCPACCTTWKGG